MNARKIFIYGIICFITVSAQVFAAQAENTTRRFGIFIGSNNGGRERVTLRYAVTDARSMSNVFTEMGGIAYTDSILLVEPTVREINRRIDAMHEQVLRARGTNRRTEIVFYYSGHSDEDGLLLNREKYTYRDLRERINNIPSDMRIVILDSCASGAFTRLKGGERTLPFLMDSSFTAEGYAFLTSSSANEASQESDRIGASFFTHSLVAGLRGAADSVGDGRVTLNELYRFAYAETIARTETSLFGTQHPSYDIQISGTGDLVLTDVSQTSAGIAFDENLTGRISIRNSRDHLIVELTKMVRPLELGLEPGLYHVTLQQGNDLLRAEVTLAEGRRVMVTRDNFTSIRAEPTRRRGDNDDDDTVSKPGNNLYTFFFNIVNEPFYFPVIGFVNWGVGNHKTLHAGFVNTNTGDFNGMQAGFVNTTAGLVSGGQAGFINTAANGLFGVQGGFINTTRNDLFGCQAGFVNTVSGETQGTQVGFVNSTAGKLEGAQVGYINVAGRGVRRGIQFGFINYADSYNEGVPIGFISIVRKDGFRAVEYGFSEFFTYNFSFKTGVEKFYTSFITSFNQFEYDDLSGYNAGFGFGIGSMHRINKVFFINSEMSILSLNEWKDFNTHTVYNALQFVLYMGLNFGGLNILAGPSVTWLYAMNWLEKEDVRFPTPKYRIYMHDIDDHNRMVVGARIAVRLRF